MSPAPPEHRIAVQLDRLLARRGMTLTELAERVDVTVVNLSVLKNGRARAIRFSTLTALCEVLGIAPGRVRAWVKAGLIQPAETREGVWHFDFRQVRSVGGQAMARLLFVLSFVPVILILATVVIERSWRQLPELMNGAIVRMGSSWPRIAARRRRRRTRRRRLARGLSVGRSGARPTPRR